MDAAAENTVCPREQASMSTLASSTTDSALPAPNPSTAGAVFEDSDRAHRGGARPYKCEQCVQAFVRKSHLARLALALTGNFIMKPTLCYRARFSCMKNRMSH